MMTASEPANTSELTDEQLDALLGSADQDLLRHVQDKVDLAAALAGLLAGGPDTETGADPSAQTHTARNKSQGHSEPTGLHSTQRALASMVPDTELRSFNDLVKRYGPLVGSICARYKLTPEESDHVRLEVWRRLAENFESIREAAALPGWLATITARECQHLIRGRRREHDYPQSAPEDQSPPSPKRRG